MKKRFLASLIAAATAAQSFALSFVDIDVGSGYLNVGGTAAGTFNIATSDGDGPITIGAPYNYGTFSDVAGYLPGTHTLTSATIEFFFRDDTFGQTGGDAQEKLTIVLDGNTFVGPDAQTQNGQFSILGGAATGSIFLSLQTDGILGYSVTSTAGDFSFDFALLRAEAVRTVQPPSVPDNGATVSLLGLALFVLSALARRRNA